MLASEQATNTYIAHLKGLLGATDSRVLQKEIADYGVHNVSMNEDHKLASYFFVISNLKMFSPLARDFFTDVMVYCEDQMGPLKSADVIREKYEKEIRPTL